MSTRQRSPRRRRPTSFIPEGLCLEERCLLSINLTMNPIGTHQEGVPIGSQVVASFTFDSGSLTDYSAEITWGDGTSSVGQIAADSGGGGTITGNHTYTAIGSEYLGVTVVGDGEIGAGRTPVAVVEPPPMAHADSYTIPHGQTLVTHSAASGVMPYGVLANDVDSEGGALSAALVSSVQHGTLTFDSDGMFTYTPAAGFVGTDMFTYQAENATSSSPATVVTINVVANAPVASDDFYTLSHGQTLTTTTSHGVLANDLDADGRPLTASLVSSVQNGTLSFAPDGTFTYTPNAGFYGTDSFTYQDSDGLLTSNVAMVTIDVTESAPIAQNDSYSVGHDRTLSETTPFSGVLGNDTDADGDTLTASLVSNVQHGTLSLAGGGTFTYTPAAGFSGTDSFTYRDSDGLLMSNVATVAIAVTESAPVAKNDTYSVTHDTTLYEPSTYSGVMANDTDTDGDTLTASLVSGVQHGTLSLNSNGSFTYTPAAGFYGGDSFTYQASDGLLTSNIAVVSILVTDGPPVARNDTYSVAHGWTLIESYYDYGVLSNDSDPDGDPLTASVVSNVQHGTLSFNSNGTFTYAPATGFYGADRFTYQGSDGVLTSNVATVIITVTGNAPVANDDAYTVASGQSLSISNSNSGLLGNDADADGDRLTASLVSNVQHGTLSLNNDGTFTYTPNAGFSGDDLFTYQASDGVLAASATVNIDVTNQAPIANDLDYSVEHDSSLTTYPSSSPVGVLYTDVDPNHQAMTASLVSTVQHGSLSLNSNGSFAYTPSAGFYGTDSFAYSVSDGSYTSNTATVTLHVLERAPIANDDGYTIVHDSTLSESSGSGVLANDIDADDDPLTASLVSNVQHGTLSLAGNGAFTYTPNAGFTGMDSFTYQASDGVLTSTIATVTITVTERAPIAKNDVYSLAPNQTLSETSFSSGVQGNDSIFDGATVTSSLVSNVQHGSLTLNGDGTFSYTPNAGFTGADEFTYQESDGVRTSNVATVTITVVESAPIAANDAYSVGHDRTLSETATSSGVLVNDTDHNGATLTASLVTNVQHGSLSLAGNGTFTYTPGAGFYGTDRFTYQDSDGLLTSNVATVTIAVTESAPVANDDVYLMTSGTTLSRSAVSSGVLGNDTDADGDPLTAPLTSNVQHGTLSFNSNGTFSYTPSPGFYGTDSFTYQASDGLMASNIATVVFGVAEVAPVANDVTYTVSHGTVLATTPATGVLANYADGNTVALVAIPNQVTAAGQALNVALLASDPDQDPLTFTTQIDTLAYVLEQEYGFHFTGDYYTNWGGLGEKWFVDAASNWYFILPNGSLYRWDGSNQATGRLVASLDPSYAANPTTLFNAPAGVGPATAPVLGTTLTVTPNAGFVGLFYVTVMVDDGHGGSAAERFTVTVESSSNPPVLAPIADQTTAPGQAFAVALSASDPDQDPLTITAGAETLAYVLEQEYGFHSTGNYYTNWGGLGEKWFVDAASNSYFILPDGNLYRWDNNNLAACTLVASLAPSYATDPTTLFEAQAGGGPAGVSMTGTTLVVTPDAGFVGVFYITVLVDAGSGGTTTGQFEVTVGSSSSPPLVTASLVSTVQHGSLIFNSDGSFIYTPAGGFYGVDSFAYQASDGSKTSGIAAAALDVTDVHAPVADDDTYTVPHDTALVVSSVPAGVLGNDTDADGDTLTASLVTGPSEGTLTLNADGTFDYVPDAGFYGQDFFTYQASDGARSSNVATVFINITPTGSPVPLSPDALFTDDFSESILDPAWQPTGGTWSINAGNLSQTATDAGGSYKLLNIMTFPADLELTAKVRVDSWSGTVAAWAGVGLDCDPNTGAGYNLVFRGNNTVAFLDDTSGTWGNSYAFSWSVGTWYDFALEVVGSTLYGSIWADGTAQPATWMFQQTGWTDATSGAPALDGGTGGNATASFQDVAVTYAPDAPDDYAAPPVIDSPATASEEDVTGDSTELSVGAEVPGDSGADLTYTWLVVAAPQGAFDPVLSDNDSDTADDVTAQFWMAGDYSFLVKVDNDGSIAISAVSVTVEQTATSLAITPAQTVVDAGDAVQYSATVYDQFGDPMESPPTIEWSVSGVGTIDEDGLYTAPNNQAGTATIEAESGDASKTLSVFVTTGDLINFDNLPAYTIVTNQYPQATFSGDPAYPNEAIPDTDASQPNSIGAPTPTSDGGASNGNPYDHPLYIDFTQPVDDLQFLQMRDDAAAGTEIEQVNVFQNGEQTATVPVYSTGQPHTPGKVDLSAYSGITRIEIVDVTDPAGLLYDDFRFKVASDLLTAHRTGDNLGEVVSEQVKDSDDPSRYTVLVDDNYVQSDGTPALDSQTADIPSSGEGDSDLAQITLNQLPAGMTDGSVQIVLSDPSAVRLFQSDGSLFYDEDSTGDGPLTLDLSNPSGYLSGLQSGNVDVWLEAVHPSSDFSFTVLYKDSQGNVFDSDTIHMTLADWTFRDYDGLQLAAIDPIWEPPFLATLEQEVEAGIQGGIDEEPQSSTFKNQVVGLPDSANAQIQVASVDDPSDSYFDELNAVGGVLVSNDYGAVISSDEILSADPDAPLTPAEKTAALNLDEMNILDGSGQQSTLTVGPTGNPTDSFTRKLVIPGPLTIALNNPNAIYHVGDTITAVVTESKMAGPVWADGLSAVLTDGVKLAGTPTGNPGQFTFSFPATAAGYITFTVNNSTVQQRDRVGIEVTPPISIIDNYTNSVSIMILPATQASPSTWQQQAWQALTINGVVTGNVVNRNRQITTLYANMYNSNTQAFGWAGMAAFASNLAGTAMAQASNASGFTKGVAATLGVDPNKLLDYLGQGNLAIFMDMYPQVLAYQAGGLTNIQAMRAQGLITAQQLDAWTDIDSGLRNNNPTSIWSGNGMIVLVEQTETIQKVFDKDLGLWKTLTDLWWNPMVGKFASPIPGDTSTFQDLYPGASIADGWRKYTWNVLVMVPAFQTWQQINQSIDIGKLLNGGYAN